MCFGFSMGAFGLPELNFTRIFHEFLRIVCPINEDNKQPHVNTLCSIKGYFSLKKWRSMQWKNQRSYYLS